MIAKYVERLTSTAAQAGTSEATMTGHEASRSVSIPSNGLLPTSRRARPWSSSTTRTARTRRPDLRRGDGHPRVGGLRGPLHLRVPLRAVVRGRLRPTRTTADVFHQPGQARHRLHSDRRRPRGHRHRYQRRRPRHDDAVARRPASRAVDFTRPGHGSRCGPRRAVSCADPAHRGRRRPGDVGRPRSGRRHLRDRQPKDEGAMAQGDELRVFADDHGLALISIADLIAWRRRTKARSASPTRAFPTDHGVPRGRLHLHFRRRGARRTGDRGHQRRQRRRRARARPLSA